jgi:hypothetical protein
MSIIPSTLPPGILALVEEGLLPANWPEMNPDERRFAAVDLLVCAAAVIKDRIGDPYEDARFAGRAPYGGSEEGAEIQHYRDEAEQEENEAALDDSLGVVRWIAAWKVPGHRSSAARRARECLLAFAKWRRPWDERSLRVRALALGLAADIGGSGKDADNIETIAADILLDDARARDLDVCVDDLRPIRCSEAYLRSVRVRIKEAEVRPMVDSGYVSVDRAQAIADAAMANGDSLLACAWARTIKDDLLRGLVDLAASAGQSAPETTTLRETWLRMRGYANLAA